MKGGDELKFREKELQRFDEEEELHGKLSAAKAIWKILQENDMIVLREAMEKSTKQTEKEFLTLRQSVGSKHKGLPARKLRKRIIKLMIPLSER